MKDTPPMPDITDQFANECLDVFRRADVGPVQAMRAVLEFAFGHREPAPDAERTATIDLKTINAVLRHHLGGDWWNLAQAILALYDAPAVQPNALDVDRVIEAISPHVGHPGVQQDVAKAILSLYGASPPTALSIGPLRQLFWDNGVKGENAANLARKVLDAGILGEQSDLAGKLAVANARIADMDAEIGRLMAERTGTIRLTEAQEVAAHDVIAERQRQVSAEGWTTEHDDEHCDGELAFSAAAYANHSAIFRDAGALGMTYKTKAYPPNWPWAREWWKPTTPRRDLVKAGALILAEIERLDRATLRASAAPKTEPMDWVKIAEATRAAGSHLIGHDKDTIIDGLCERVRALEAKGGV
jgi:hypothetical protein